MKYENPTCEIVLLDRVDCLVSSEELDSIRKDSPFVNYPNY